MPLKCPVCGRFLRNEFVRGLLAEGDECPRCGTWLSPEKFATIPPPEADPLADLIEAGGQVELTLDAPSPLYEPAVAPGADAERAASDLDDAVLAVLEDDEPTPLLDESSAALFPEEWPVDAPAAATVVADVAGEERLVAADLHQAVAEASAAVEVEPVAPPEAPRDVLAGWDHRADVITLSPGGGTITPASSQAAFRGAVAGAALAGLVVGAAAPRRSRLLSALGAAALAGGAAAAGAKLLAGRGPDGGGSGASAGYAGVFWNRRKT